MMMMMMMIIIIIIIIICYKEAKDKTRVLSSNLSTYYTTLTDNITSHNVSSTLTLFLEFTLSSFSLCNISPCFRDRELCVYLLCILERRHVNFSRQIPFPFEHKKQFELKISIVSVGFNIFFSSIAQGCNFL
jgi:hypothetical protein